jgi:hypothetical protein
MKLPKVKLTTDTLVLLAILAVSIVALYLRHMKKDRDDDDDDDDDNGKKGRKKRKQIKYPIPLTSYMYEEVEDLQEEVCDKVFKDKCNQECKKGLSPTCVDCMIICDKHKLRV